MKSLLDSWCVRDSSYALKQSALIALLDEKCSLEKRAVEAEEKAMEADEAVRIAEARNRALEIELEEVKAEVGHSKCVGQEKKIRRERWRMGLIVLVSHKIYSRKMGTPPRTL